MARIAGVDLPRNKHANIALTYIYGIGNSRAARILDAAKVDPMKKVSDLGEDEVNRIRQVIEAEGSVEGDLRKDVSMNIKRLIEIGSSRGFLHRRNLPVTHPHQCPYPKRSAQRDGRAEEEDCESIGTETLKHGKTSCSRRRRGARQKRQEENVQEERQQTSPARAGARSGFFQQHHRDHHGYVRKCSGMEELGFA